MNTLTDKLAAALRGLPDEYDMIEHNPDEGPRLFCCGGAVAQTLRSTTRKHAPDCWYVRVREALAEYDAQRDQNAGPKEVPVCAQCGSTEVAVEVVSAYWIVSEQDWEVSDICDKGHYCNHCGRETRLTWRPATPEEIRS